LKVAAAADQGLHCHHLLLCCVGEKLQLLYHCHLVLLQQLLLLCRSLFARDEGRWQCLLLLLFDRRWLLL
jgi:hypothetical protein